MDIDTYIDDNSRFELMTDITATHPFPWYGARRPPMVPPIVRQKMMSTLLNFARDRDDGITLDELLVTDEVRAWITPAGEFVLSVHDPNCPFNPSGNDILFLADGSELGYRES